MGGEESGSSSVRGLWGKVCIVLCGGSFSYKLDGSLYLPNVSSHCTEDVERGVSSHRSADQEID